MPISKVSKLLYDPRKFAEVQNIIGAGFSDQLEKITRHVSKPAQDVINPKSGFVRVAGNLLESLTYPILGLPRDIFDFTARKLGAKFSDYPIMSRINKWQPLVKYRRGKEAKQAERILRGMYDKLSSLTDKRGQKFLGEAAGAAQRRGRYEACHAIFDELNKNAAPNVARYNTRDGEGLKRLVTALIPIPFLFKDSFYISKKNGMSDDKAKKMAWNKANQELIAAGGESLGQFTILGGVPRFINSSNIAAPMINTVIGVGFHIISRLRTGRKLTHLTKDEVTKRSNIYKIDDLQDFKKHVAKQENLAKQEPKKDGKKHLLSFKNLLIFAGTSIAAGFLLAMGKNKALEHLKKEENIDKLVTKIFNKITGTYERITREDRIGKKHTLEGMIDILKDSCDENMISAKFNPILRQMDEAGGRLSLGTVDRVVKLPIVDIQIPVKKLIELPFVPIRMLFELASYPYKAVRAILEQVFPRPDKSILGTEAAKKMPRAVLEKIGLLRKENSNVISSAVDKYDIMNLYNKYAELVEKTKGQEGGATRAFNEFFHDNFLRTFDMERASKIDNSKIGKLTQLLGMTGGIYFATNDDYNQTLSETGSIEKAHADQRKRGVQKFTRVTTGVAISDWFNQAFIRNYNNSLPGALAVVAASTFAVDKATRFMLGQPSKRMTDKQLKEFEAQKKESVMAPFYKLTETVAK